MASWTQRAVAALRACAYRLSPQERLRELARTQAGKVDVFCAHDVTEWKRLADAAAKRPEPVIPVAS